MQDRYYWSSTTWVNDAAYAWTVPMYGRGSNNNADNYWSKTLGWYVWPVRGGLSTKGYPPTTIASPPGGIYNVPQTVTLTNNEPATIYYTLDGSEPTTTSG